MENRKDTMMTTENEFDLAKMQQRVDEKRKKQEQETYDQWDKERQRADDEQAEVNELFAKSILSEREDNEKLKAKEMEAEKAKAIKGVEVKYENQGIKSDATKQLDDAYKDILKNIPGMND